MLSKTSSHVIKQKQETTEKNWGGDIDGAHQRLNNHAIVITIHQNLEPFK